MNIKQHNEKILKEFNKNFTQPDYGWGSEGYATKMISHIKPEELVQFITKALSERDTIIVDLLENEKDNEEYSCMNCNESTKALDKVINLIKENA